jgi:murein DD-endopeptidase MepM/ murein hydrolase activator NlpD
MSRLTQLELYLKNHPEYVSPLVDFNSQTDQLFPFDFSSSNQELDLQIIVDTASFSSWISQKLKENNCRYGIGGYDEHRTIYGRSELFDNLEEPRRLHLGIDIWADAGTPVYAPLSGQIHSFRFNDNFGDYGATLILQHDLDGLILHSLYGHLSLSSIDRIQKGAAVKQGEKIAEFGIFSENGNWPPHLHFQLVFDMQDYDGDYPGVCRFSERINFLGNCPDPAILLNQTFN